MKLFISTKKAIYGAVDSTQDLADELLSLVYPKGVAPVFSEEHSFWTYPSQGNSRQRRDEDDDDALIIAGFELHLEAQ